jgi:hypothetical protein
MAIVAQGFPTLAKERSDLITFLTPQRHPKPVRQLSIHGQTDLTSALVLSTSTDLTAFADP